MLLLFALIVTLLLRIYFSVAEMAFSSLNRVRIKSMAETGSDSSARATKVAKLYEECFDEVISTLLIWNNMVAMTSAIISAVLFVRLLGEWGYFVSTIVISAIVIVFTDIFPKRLSRENPEKIAIWCLPFLKFLMVILKLINRFILKMKDDFGKNRESDRSP